MILEVEEAIVVTVAVLVAVAFIAAEGKQMDEVDQVDGMLIHYASRCS